MSESALEPDDEREQPERTLTPANVKTAGGHYAADHVESYEHALRAYNYDEDDPNSIAELVDFPWHRVHRVEYLPAEEAHEHAPEVDPQ
ncbi:MAG: hypothetical protein ABEJ84_01940 [Halodesulfurarchaeum sp.]